VTPQGPGLTELTLRLTVGITTRVIIEDLARISGQPVTDCDYCDTFSA